MLAKLILLGLFFLPGCQLFPFLKQMPFQIKAVIEGEIKGHHIRCEKTLKLGMWAGLSVYPFTKLSPERVMNILKKHGTERIMTHSAADWGVSDPLSVALVAREMRKAGFSATEIEKVTFLNAYEFFKQSPKFTWRP